MYLLILGLALAASCAAQFSTGAGQGQATAPAPSPSTPAPAAQERSSAGAAENADPRPEGTEPGTAVGAEELALESQIQNALGKDPTLIHDSVRVAVSADGVELTGSVASSRERLTATRIAQSYAGSKRVVTRITVAASPQESAPPEKKNVSGSQRQFRR